MLFRIARVGVVATCALALIAALGAGIADASPRAGKSVIGGTPASVDQWPFAAAVLTPTTLCTGTVISSTKVLTAGHCVGDPATMTVQDPVALGVRRGRGHSVSSVAYAPGFSHGFENDLAILTLRTPTSTTPIQVASAAEDAAYTRPGAQLAVAGYGNRNPLIVGKPRSAC